MVESIHEIFKKKVVPVTFERNIGLFGATSIGVGALLGAGIYVLIGLAAGIAGPSVWLSYLLCGIVAFCTTLLFAELARIIPVTGGGYAYTYKTLGSFGSFMTGWFLALGSIFACSLYAIGFAEYFSSLLGYDVSGFGIKFIALLTVFTRHPPQYTGNKKWRQNPERPHLGKCPHSFRPDYRLPDQPRGQSVNSCLSPGNSGNLWCHSYHIHLIFRLSTYCQQH